MWPFKLRKKGLPKRKLLKKKFIFFREFFFSKKRRFSWPQIEGPNGPRVHGVEDSFACRFFSKSPSGESHVAFAPPDRAGVDSAYIRGVHELRGVAEARSKREGDVGEDEELALPGRALN